MPIVLIGLFLFISGDMLPMDKPMVSLIIPVYNEVGSIRLVVEDAKANCVGSYEIIIVNDGSNDGTAEVLRGIATAKTVRVLEHKVRGGYDNALKSGISSARGKVLVILDGDGQTDLSSLAYALRTLRPNEIITGIRQNRESLFRRINSACYRSVLRVFFGFSLNDINGKPKIFWKKDLGHVQPTNIKSGIYDFLLLLEAKKHGVAIRALPVRHLPRISGRSKMLISDLPRMLALFFKLKFA